MTGLEEAPESSGQVEFLPDYNLLSDFSPGDSGLPNRRWGEDVSRVSRPEPPPKEKIRRGPGLPAVASREM